MAVSSVFFFGAAFFAGAGLRNREFPVFGAAFFFWEGASCLGAGLFCLASEDAFPGAAAAFFSGAGRFFWGAGAFCSATARRFSVAACAPALGSSGFLVLPEVAVDARVEVTLKAVPELNDNHVAQRVYQLLQQAQIDNYAKEAAFLAYCTYSDPATVLSQMKLRGVPEETRGAMEEIMTAKE